MSQHSAVGTLAIAAGVIDSAMKISADKLIKANKTFGLVHSRFSCLRSSVADVEDFVSLPKV